MTTKDFHGYRLDDAIREAELIIGEVRMAKQSQHIQFITGHGSIKDALIALFDRYNLKAEISWSNSGMISVLIE